MTRIAIGLAMLLIGSMIAGCSASPRRSATAASIGSYGAGQGSAATRYAAIAKMKAEAQVQAGDEYEESVSTVAEGRSYSPAPERPRVGAQDRRLADATPLQPAQASSPGTAGAAPPKPQAPPTAIDVAHDPSLIIYSAHLTMSVFEVAAQLEAVDRIARELGGYLSSRADNEIVIRVPRAKFDDALARVEKLGDVLHRTESAEDVTDEFIDLEARLHNARAMRERLSLLLQKADVKDALEIEKELGRVTGEIERIEGRLKLLRDKIAYSTITVTFEGRGQAALRSARLPFSWLQDMGLANLLNLHN